MPAPIRKKGISNRQAINKSRMNGVIKSRIKRKRKQKELITKAIKEENETDNIST